tara:strand:+ start:7289 stop:7474 length:186 start_codon:yes stop_codon:yes gene_type:complete
MLAKFRYKCVNKNIISKIMVNTINHERREIGLQIADFQERKKKYQQKIKYAETIKNQGWLG